MVFDSSGQRRWEELTHAPSAGNASQQTCRSYFKNTEEPYPIWSEKPRPAAGKPNPRPLSAPAPTQVSSTATWGTIPTPEQDRRHQQKNYNDSSHPKNPPMAATGKCRSCSTTTAAPASLSNHHRKRLGPATAAAMSRSCSHSSNVPAQRRRRRELTARHAKGCRTQLSGLPGNLFQVQTDFCRRSESNGLPALPPDTC